MPDWLIPTTSLIPAGGVIRSVGEHNRTAYHRAYYHAKRRGRKQTYTPEMQAKRRERRMVLYYINVERERALARARYWRNKARKTAS